MRASLRLTLLPGVLALAFQTLCHADAVRLKISGPGGKPVAGAHVRVVELLLSGNPRETARFSPSLELTSNKAGMVAFESKHPFGKPLSKGEPPGAGAQMIATVRFPGLVISNLWLKAGENTLALQTGQTLEGIALDANQKPIARAHFRVTQLGDGGFDYLLTPAELPEATTDASGHFRFESLPTSGEIEVEVDDALWKRERFLLDLSQKAPPLFLERGSTIKGRLLKPDGSPASGVSIFAGDPRHPAKTRADGTFEATGIGGDNVYMQVSQYGQKLSFIVDPRTINDLKAGEVRDTGDWKAKRGVHAQGRVVDADTAKPLARANVSLWGPSDGVGQTNADGIFDILMAPGSTMISAVAQGYVPLMNPGVGDPKNGVIEVGTLELKRGKTVSGVLLDGQGNAIPNYPLSLRKKNGNMGDGFALTRADGKFSFSGLDTGDYTIRVQGFKIAQGEKFSIGAKTPLPSLRVVASADIPAGTTSANPASPRLQKVTGRVEALDGTPIAGAKIDLRIMLSETSSLIPKALSQDDGSFSTAFSPAFVGIGRSLTVVGINRPGFLLGATTVTPANGGWNVTIKMQPKGAALRGRVVDASGQGVPHAFVGVQSGTDLPVSTDENGDFILKDVPLEAITLLASNGPALAAFDVTKAGQKVEITLPDVPPPTDANKTAAIDALLQNASFAWEWKDQWDALGQKRVEFIITHGGIGDDNGANQREWAWGQYIGELARREPRTFLAREAELRAAIMPNNRALFERLLMLCSAAYGSDEQKANVRAHLEQEEKVKRDLSSSTVTDLLNLAEISARLDPKTAQTWLDYAGQIADQLPNNGGEAAQDWGKTIARTKKDAPLSFGDGWKPTVELMLLNSAMYGYVEIGDLPDARRAYERSKKLGELAAQKSVIDIKTKPYSARPSELVQQTTALYVRVLSRTDPLAALALSPAMGDYDRAKTLDTIARNAIALKKFDAAKKAIEATFQLPYSNMEYVAGAAVLAQQFDPSYAETLWPRVYAKARPNRSDREGGWQPSLSTYAGARAALFPGQSRILIEREWQYRLAQAKKSAPTGDESDNDFDEGGVVMSSMVEAMARVYPPRALEMLPTITQRNNMRDHTSLKLAVALLTPSPTAP